MSIAYPQLTTSHDLLRSVIKLPHLIPFLKQQHTEIVAITNSSLYGVLPFYEAMIREGIQPVIGLEVNIVTNDSEVPAVLYAQNDNGYQNLLKISSAIETSESKGLPLKWLQAYEDGCQCMLLLPEQLGENQDMFYNELEQLVHLLKNRCVAGVSRPGGQINVLEAEWVNFFTSLNIPIIATQSIHFLQKEDVQLYKTVRAIQDNSLVKFVELSEQEKHAYAPTKDQWDTWFSDHHEWLERTTLFMRNCFGAPKQEPFKMPSFPTPNETKSEEYLRDLCKEGLQKRVENITESYEKRLEKELSIIKEMGYSDYFLIVWDFMKYARSIQLLTGPGRGSSASSLVAYCLYITHVDPLQYGLFFERFLNPERVSLPDIDIDFVDYRRDEMFHYLAEKYGKQHVAQIITFGTLSAKLAAREVGRVFGFSQEVLSMISSQIPNRPGTTLQEAYESSKKLAHWIDSNPIHQSWWETAKQIEGLPRNASVHAAGVVLSEQPIVRKVPLELGHEHLFLTQWPMKEVEKSGLLKMDFLGLRNLTILDRIRTLIWKNEKKWIEFEQIPLTDRSTYQLLRRGDTLGIFQLESPGMKQALRQIQPSTFLDIVVVNALYRPGPMEFIPLYAQRKNEGQSISYIHPSLQPILQETYGVIVYQEQIMQIAVQLAGFTFGEADNLRRAISKKNTELMEQQKEAFAQGCLQNGLTEKAAHSIFSLIERFAEYGFPKSHAVAYSVISYQMAYFKSVFPTYFYAAYLSTVAGNESKLLETIGEMKRKGIKLLPPSIQKSDYGFSVESNQIRVGLQAVKGVSYPFIEKMTALRKNESLAKNLFDFAVQMTPTFFQRKQMEPLIKSGALDHFGVSRSTLLASIDAAESYAKLIHSFSDGTPSFDIFGEQKYIDGGAVTDAILLQYEKETLGFYVSTHPLENVRKTISEQTLTIWELVERKNKQSVTLLTQISSIKKIRTKKGEAMAFIDLIDETGSISATTFPKVWEQVEDHIQEKQIVLCHGKLEWRQGSPQFLVQSITFSK